MTVSGVPESTPSRATTSALLERVRSHDQAAWERFVSLFTPLVYRWCLQQRLQPVDVEEVCQEVFLSVAQGIRDCEHDWGRNSFRDWLRTITRNQIRDHIGSLQQKEVSGSDASEAPRQVPGPGAAKQDTDSEGQEVAILCRRAVQLIEVEFELQTRRAFWLLAAGRRPDDVATELKMSVAAVYLAQSRISKRLHEEFGDLLEDEPVSKRFQNTPAGE
jgi:RNA polymerase sigma-70 factor (ECF subfamily)